MRLLAAAGLFLAGCAVGLASALVHTLWWGLPLAVSATGCSLAALPAGWWARLPFGVAFAAMVGYLATPRPEGDYVVAGNLRGYLLLGWALAVLVASIVTLRLRHRTVGRGAPS